MQSFRPPPKKSVYWHLLFPSLVVYSFIPVTNPPKKHPPNWNSIKTSCCTFSIHGLGFCTYLALRAGDVFSPQLRHCWGEHAQGDRQDDQTWLHLKSRDVFGGDGIRSQNAAEGGVVTGAIGKFPEAKTESRKRRSNFQRLRFALGGGWSQTWFCCQTTSLSWAKSANLPTIREQIQDQVVKRNDGSTWCGIQPN